MTEREGFSEALQERLSNTPIGIDVLIEEVNRKGQLAALRTQLRPKNPIFKCIAKLAPMVEGFLRTIQQQGEDELVTMSNIRDLLITFRDRVSDKLRPDQAEIMAEFLFDECRDVKSLRFIDELPWDEFVEQEAMSRDEFEDFEESEGYEDEPEEYTEPSDDEIQAAEQFGRIARSFENPDHYEYNRMSVSLIRERARSVLLDLFFKECGIKRFKLSELK